MTRRAPVVGVRSARMAPFIGLLTIFAAGCGAEGDGADEPRSAFTSSSGALSSKSLPDLPDPSLAVPAGNRLSSSFPAVGVQIYACRAVGPSFAWNFVAPEATLLNPGGQTAGIHFAGPTWQTDDGSQVVGVRLVGVTVDPSAIPWLLLGAASHAGDGRMARISFIQRLDTQGGVAPVAGCDAAHLGELARVAYTARYFFYAPAP